MLGGACLPPFQSSSSHRLLSRPANLLSPPDIVLTPSPTEAEEESRPAAPPPPALRPSPSSLPLEAVRSRSNSRSKQLASPALEAVPEGPGENGSCGSCSSSDKDVVEDEDRSEENRLSVPSPTGGGGRRESSTSSTGAGGGEIEHGGRRESLISPSAVCCSRRQSGSRRLSVGAMVSLSTLRAETGSRLTSKTIPIINPLVKNPNWPNLDRCTTLAGRGLISLVVLTTADMLCAPVTPIMDWTPPPERMEEIGVMNNYFGIGIDAKIALDFHHKREEQQSAGRQSRSRAKNYLWYGMLGSKELVQK